MERSESRRPPRVVGERENVFKRLNYIFQVSRLAALPGQEGKESISRFYARQGKRLTERLCVRTAGGASFGCRGCGVALVLGSTATARVRVRGRKRSKTRARSRDARIVLRCLRCGHVTRKRVRKRILRGKSEAAGKVQDSLDGKCSEGRGVETRKSDTGKKDSGRAGKREARVSTTSPCEQSPLSK